ncbi:glycoside hydrolase family 16 protein [Pseudonocardia sp. ICBG1142]|uniref:glycoside hydrolase family 16 protein n=1 Tax=Pseudonocardia sp. ICBG1142 TaxID=2846760 RepID=UPI001CF68005|nr:glycoside hydrolase family 16 protein [Pseudonocardia sp. ICBG1142]
MGLVGGVSALAAAAALLLGSATPDKGPAETADAVCGWRIAATHVLAELDLGSVSGSSAGVLRAALLALDADEPGFVPVTCYATGVTGQSGDHENGSNDHQPPGTPPGGSSSPAGSSSLLSAQDQGQGQGDTAGEVFGWGTPDVVDDFTGTQLGPDWNAYDGSGHAGNGVRSPAAATVAGGVLTIDGSGDGTTAGLAWTAHSQKFGRWETRMRAPTGSPSYNALALLWPTQENFPIGGEIDFAEIMDPSRDKIELFLHYGADNSQVHGELKIDATQWHNYAVEWTSAGVTAFVDGREWWKTEDTSILPPGPMHLCLQLDWFPRGDGESGRMQVDWVKQWGLAAGEGSSTTSGGSEGSTDADSSTSITDEVNNVDGR